METRSPGPGAPDVAAISYGGMPLSIRDRPDEATGIAVLHAVLDAGVTLLDTADVYCLDHKDIGHNERLFAKALKTWSGDRHNLVVATKGGMVRPEGGWEHDGRPAHLNQACDKSCLARPDFPLPVGVLRAVEQACYEDMLQSQVDDAIDQRGAGTLAGLLHSGDTWQVEGYRNIGLGGRALSALALANRDVHGPALERSDHGVGQDGLQVAGVGAQWRTALQNASSPWNMLHR